MHKSDTEDLNILALARLEMIGVHGAPKSFFITADMPLALGKTNHGVGLVVFTEAIGLFQNTHVGAQYAYKYKLFGGVLSGGLQIGLVNQSFDGTKVVKVESEYHQETDAAIPVEQVSGMGCSSALRQTGRLCIFCVSFYLQYLYYSKFKNTIFIGIMPLYFILFYEIFHKSFFSCIFVPDF